MEKGAKCKLFSSRRYFLPQRFAAKTPLVVLFRPVLLPSGINLQSPTTLTMRGFRTRNTAAS